MADMTPITYSANAHTAELAQRPHDVESEHSRRFRMLAASGQRLPRRQPTVDIAPIARGLEMVPPKQLRHVESQSEHTPRPNDRDKHLIRMDEECLRYTSQTKVNFIIGIVRGLGMVGFFSAIFVFCASLVIIFFAASPHNALDFKEYWNWGVKFYTTLSLVFLGMWGGANLIYRLFPNFAAGYQPGPMWELNRRTGMVTVFANPAKKRTAWQVEHQLPFHEFDCYLQSTPSHQGLPQFNLSLAHYRQEVHVALVGMFGATSSHVEQRAAWDTVQRYMDTSQPLPDTPVFKMYRQLDPTSLEHDRRSGRPPRYWRDMDDETFAQKVHEHQDKLNEFYR